MDPNRFKQFGTASGCLTNKHKFVLQFFTAVHGQKHCANMFRHVKSSDLRAAHAMTESGTMNILYSLLARTVYDLQISLIAEKTQW